KTLIGKEGQIFGDYDYKGPRDFSFSLELDGRRPLTWKSQRLLLARAPILRTVKTVGDVTVTEDAFLEIPEPEPLNSIVRYDSRRVESDWSKPKYPADNAFHSVAMGLKGLSGEGLVEFHIRVRPGASYSLALGFCEGHYDTAGIRKMRIQVEGAQQKDIDPVKDFGAHVPGIYTFLAADADSNGILTVVVSNMPGSLDRDAFVNALWMFDGKMPAAADIISGKEDKTAVLYAPCADVRMPARRYHVLVKVRNGGSHTVEFQPELRYRGVEPVRSAGGDMAVGNETMVAVSGGGGQLHRDSAGAYHFELPAMKLKAGEERELAVTVSRFFGGDGYQPTAAMTKKEEGRALNWWKKNCPSAAAVSVPDTGIQAMIESSIRNIFQARDIRKGSPSFHVGPTIYRGLWLADGTYILEVATMLGYIRDVRSCIDYLTHYQLPGGGFEMITTFHKENGLVPLMLIRHAMLTQDKGWLEKNWGVVEGCLRRIRYLRDVAARDPSKPYYGLLPDGNVDGGIQHGDDYSNTEYCLAGMKWAIMAAHWLGKETQAAAWQKEYDDFFNTFLTMARKDLRKDDKGNTYLPVMIHNEGHYPPQKGQWAFCQSVYPGQIFDTTEETRKIASGTVQMLHDHRVEGLVINTGWMEQGLWTYFSSFYGHDLLWLGKTREVPQLLYDYANHSSPTMDWREEQKPQGKGNDEVGDMPHNWASAEFIRLVVHMIELDRGHDLHLFEALPPEWMKPGKRVALHGIRTPFGPVELSLVVNARGDAAQLHLQFTEKGHLPGKVVIHKDNWTASGGVSEVAGASTIDMNIPLIAGKSIY
ncbi:MAG TPA: hypothetical protein VG605_05545, partial [Puia sp.]|nr:hypothetical protein [Puia sp.]